MAGPGRGKSQWLCHVARDAVKAGKTVVYYTLEMDSKVVAQRVWAGIIDMDTEAMSKVENFAEVRARTSQWEQYARGEVDENGDLILNTDGTLVREPWGELIIKRYPAGSATVAMLAAHLQKLDRLQSITPDIIVVDYADILGTNRKYDVRRDELATIYEALRGLGQLLDVPIWTACQANREGSKRGSLRLEDVSDSWDKAKIADYIWGLTVDTDGSIQDVRMAPLKVRNNAACDPIPFGIDFTRAMFYDRGMAA